MSVKTQLRRSDSPLRVWIGTRFPGLGREARALGRALRASAADDGLLGPSLGDHGLIGTAFEYRLMAGHCAFDLAYSGATNGRELLRHGVTTSPTLLGVGRAERERIRVLLPQLDATWERAEDELRNAPVACVDDVPEAAGRRSKSALLMASYETLLRGDAAGVDALKPVVRRNDEAQLEPIPLPDEWADELTNLVRAHFALRPQWRECLVEWFRRRPSHAALADGAEPDWVADGVLVDFKTERKPRLGNGISQVLAYALLDVDDHLGLEAIELEYVCHRCVWRLPLSQLGRLRGTPTTLDEERAALRDHLVDAPWRRS